MCRRYLFSFRVFEICDRINMVSKVLLGSGRLFVSDGGHELRGLGWDAS